MFRSVFPLGLTCVEFRLRRGICVQPHEVGLEPTRCTRVPLHLPAGDSSWGKTPRSPAGTILVPMSVELIDASGTNCADNVNTPQRRHGSCKVTSQRTTSECPVAWCQR